MNNLPNHRTTRADGTSTPGKTPLRSFRATDAEYQPVIDAAIRLGWSASDVIRALLDRAADLQPASPSSHGSN